MVAVSSACPIYLGPGGGVGAYFLFIAIFKHKQGASLSLHIAVTCQALGQCLSLAGSSLRCFIITLDPILISLQPPLFPDSVITIPSFFQTQFFSPSVNTDLLILQFPHSKVQPSSPLLSSATSPHQTDLALAFTYSHSRLSPSSAASKQGRGDEGPPLSSVLPSGS